METPNKLLLFLKEPKSGDVKTRLGSSIGMEEAANVYKKFLSVIAKKYSQNNWQLYVYHAGLSHPYWLKGLFGKTAQYIPQKGNDLGERLLNAAQEQFSGEKCKLIFLGGDSPDLPLEYVSEAFRQLKTHPICIGPTHDGGYYLIGLSQLFAPIFQNISWGTSSVFEESLRTARLHQKNVYQLPRWWDVDTREDYLKFLERNPDF